MRNCGLTHRKSDLLIQVCEMGISSSNRDWFNLYWWRKRMKALKHLLTERLRSHNHLPPFHAMELFSFLSSSRYGAPAIICVERVASSLLTSTA